jgi:hypothetical protein
MKPAPIATDHTEEELIAMFLANETPTCKCLKAVIYPVTGAGWIIVKNDLGHPLWRWHNQTLGFFAENNGRYFLIIGDLRQQHEGGGSYAPVYYQWTDSLELNGKFIEEALATDKGSKTKTKAKPKAAGAKSKSK